LKNSIKPTGHEIKMTENDFIVSKTDTKGKLTYANRDFMRFSQSQIRKLRMLRDLVIFNIEDDFNKSIN
jgi:hypothetical protein